MPTTISTKDYLLDKAKRRLTPSITNFPGMSVVERRLLNTDFPQKTMTNPPGQRAQRESPATPACRFWAT